jgi:uncharacterized membrane protein
MFFPSLMLSLTPLLDIVRLVTHNPLWSRLAFWSAVLGVLVAAVALVPATIDWLTADSGTRARREGAAPLVLHFAALWPLALGVVERVYLAQAARAAAAAGLPTITRLDAWPLALAVAGAAAWLIAMWMRDARPSPSVRVTYQPTGLPSRA